MCVYTLTSLRNALIDGTTIFKKGDFISIDDEIYQCYKLTSSVFKAWKMAVTKNGTERLTSIAIKW